MRASSLEIDSPNPVPPYFRLVVPSACWNASKIISSLPAGMPMPVSRTANATSPSARPTWSVTPPVSVNFTALASRLRSTCWRRWESVVIVGGTFAPISTANAEPLLLGLRAQRLLQVAEHLGEHDGTGVDLGPACLDLGEVEDVVDEPQQVRPGAVDRVGELDLPRGEVGVGVLGEQPRQQQERVQRRAQLVAHVGHELGLVLAGLRELLGLLLHAAPGRVELDVLDLDVAVLPGQLLGLLLQLGVGPLQLGDWSCSSVVSRWLCVSSSSVRRLAWMVASATPIVSTSLPRNVRCSSENGVTEPSSITPRHSPRTGRAARRPPAASADPVPDRIVR
jgi:hypothetical protein